VRGHVDSETLAAFREGLLPRRKARQVAAHVAHCAQCAGLEAQLAELPALLARSPAPPMPAALTARIEAALAAEAAARPVTEAAARPAAADTAATPAPVARDAVAAARGHRKTPAPGPGRSRLVLRAAAVAAAVVVVAGGGYGLIRLLAGGSVSAPTAAAPAMGREHAAARPSAASRGSGAMANAAPGSHGTASLRIVASGTDYQPGQLKTQVGSTLARFGGKAAAPLPAGEGYAPSTAFPGLRACVLQVAGGQYVELVDRARYEGRPAAIIVIPGARTNTLRVLVVGTPCSAGAPSPILSTLLPSRG
jgi:hypothetical protein